MFTKKIDYFCIIIIGLFIFSHFSVASAQNDLSSDLSGVALAQEDSNLPYVEGELLVRFAPKANGKQKTIDEHNQILSSFNAGKIEYSYKIVPGLAFVQLPKGVKVKDALPKLRAKNEFLNVTPNWKFEWASIPNDPNFPKQWGLNNTDANYLPGADIDALRAWDIATDSNIIIAVLDSGVDYNHPDLAANMWTDANGHHGYNFVDGNNNPMDSVGHGTHCAGIIGAVGNNGTGVTGVCWHTKIMAIRVGNDSGPNIAAVIRGIEYAVEMGAKVLSNSYGKYEGDINSVDVQNLEDAIEAADACGVLFIAAAGNGAGPWGDPVSIDEESCHFYPASYDCQNIISVLATDRNDDIAGFSNYGLTSVDLGAPGVRIYSTLPRYLTRDMIRNYLSTYYDYEDGTSQSTPMVAGACALVWSAYPNLTHLQVKEAILNSVDGIPDLNGICVTGGRLNLYKALKYWAPSPVILENMDDTYGCITPPSIENSDNLINYTIYFDSNGANDTNVVLTDYLSDLVDYNSYSDEGIYDSQARTVTWIIEPFNEETMNYITLQVKVKSSAVEGQSIINKVVLKGDNFTTRANNTTYVCSYDTVYVNKNNAESGNGRSWGTAYTDLCDAISAINYGNFPNAKRIFVAAGTYALKNTPGYLYYGITMINGIDVYGHFQGWEDNPEQRNLADGNYASILTGDVDGNNTSDARYVISAANSRLDGFTIEKGKYAGINGSSYSPVIANCKIQYNNASGVYCDSSPTVIIENCDVSDNGYEGISLRGGSNVSIINTIVSDNNNFVGVWCHSVGNIDIDHCSFINHELQVDYSILNVKDSVFDGAGISMEFLCEFNIERCDFKNCYCGISIFSSSIGSIQKCKIHNNRTGVDSGGNIQLFDNIICNNDVGVGLFDYPIEIYNNDIVDNNYGIYVYRNSNPDVNNNIFWGNNSSFGGGTFTKVNYNCIQGQTGYTGTGNITNLNPQFRDPNNDDYHLLANSPCIDRGDPNFTKANQTDFDGECRIIDGNSDGIARVDIGADEYYKSPADFNDDGYVDFLDFFFFLNSWGTSISNPGYSEQCDLYDDNSINYKDLTVFCEDWLWIAGWLMDDYERGFGGEGAYFEDTGGGMEMMMQGQGFELESAEFMQFKVEQAIDIEGILDWLDDIWFNDNLKDSMTEEEFLEFRKAVEQSQ